MMTIFTEVDEFDGDKDNFVSVEQFVNAFEKNLGIGLLHSIDYEFLTKKYRQENAHTEEEQKQVYYSIFYDDYKLMNEDGIAG